MFTLKIKTDNAAFNEGPMVSGDEISRILNEVSNRVASHEKISGTVRDINGNTVGSYKLT